MKPQIFYCALALVLTPKPAKSEEHSAWMLQYKPIVIEGRFAAYMGLKPLALDAELRKRTPRTYREAIEFFGPAFISNLSGVGSWEWHFSDGKALRSSGPYGKTLERTFDFVLFECHFPQEIKIGYYKEAPAGAVLGEVFSEVDAALLMLNLKNEN